MHEMCHVDILTAVSYKGRALLQTCVLFLRQVDHESQRTKSWVNINVRFRYENPPHQVT